MCMNFEDEILLSGGGGGGGECKMMNTQLSSNYSRTYHIQVTLCPHFARG